MPVPTGWDGNPKGKGCSQSVQLLVDENFGQLIHHAAENAQQNVNDILITLLKEIEETMRRGYKALLTAAQMSTKGTSHAL